MSTRVWESNVIDAPIENVWALVRPLDFSYLPTVSSSAIEGKLNANEVGSVHVINYKDKTVQKLRLSELSDAKHAVSWDLISSEPAHHVLSASYSIRLRPITQSSATFVEWVVDFSKDVTNEVTQDAVFKARENFKALAATVKAKLLAEAANAKVGKNKVPMPELKRQLSANSEKLHKLFASLDKNGNGVLEFDEFALAVNKLYGENLQDSHIKMLLREADTNQDNLVSYEEFTKWLASHQLEQKARDKADVPPIKIIYFPARGRAEAARVMLHEAGIPFEDVRLDYKTFVENGTKASAPFGQMPIMEVGKVKIAQSGAIFRYVAKLTGLYGRNLEESAKVDMICEAVSGDLGPEFGAAWYEKDAKLKEEKVAKFWNQTFPHWSGLLEKQLASNKDKSGYFVGSNLTMADVMVFVEGQRFLGLKPECLNACPGLHQLVTKVSSRPNIAAWLKKRPAE